MKATSASRYFHLWLLALWIVVGLVLRFANLTAKTPWTDEFATLVFSLGNRFGTVPLDQILTPEALLQPLYPRPDANAGDVLAALFGESNHPPIYFLLSHFWLKLFSTPTGIVSLWGARSLAALLGIAAIPAIFGLSWLAFRSFRVAHIAAALMATSPFAVYLAQEARHYTLPILWIIASLGCLVIAARTVRDRIPLPVWTCWVWIIVNALGIATHYFFVFTLAAEAIVIACLGLVQSWRENGRWHPSNHWWRIWIVGGGTFVSGLVWFPVLQNIQEGELTRWIYQGDRSGFAWLDPIFQAIAGWISMLYLLPIQSGSETLSTVCGIGLALLALWTLPKVAAGLQVQALQRNSRLAVSVLGCFIVSAIALFFSVTYFFDADLTGAFRYNFVYFPAVLVLVAAALASGWNVSKQIAQAPANDVPSPLLRLLRVCGRKTIVLIGCLSLIGALTVVNSLGYQKIHRPDIVAQAIQQDLQENVQADALVAIPYRSHGQIGRLMGIAWNLTSAQTSSAQTSSAQTTLGNPNIHFFLAQDTQRNSRSAIENLSKAIRESVKPLHLWLINFHEVEQKPLERMLQVNRCTLEEKFPSVDGYRYRLYRCRR